MTLPNSIISLIQYRPPGPNNIVLDMFYCTTTTTSTTVECKVSDEELSEWLRHGNGMWVDGHNPPPHAFSTKLTHIPL